MPPATRDRPCGRWICRDLERVGFKDYIPHSFTHSPRSPALGVHGYRPRCPLNSRPEYMTEDKTRYRAVKYPRPRHGVILV